MGGRRAGAEERIGVIEFNSKNMIKRLYVDNFRCLVNFELKLDRLNLLMGANGSGKSSVFAALRLLQVFLSGDRKTSEVFLSRERTLWMKAATQAFELDLLKDGTEYRYSLIVEHEEDGRRSRIKAESLCADGKALFASNYGEAQLYRDDFSKGPEVQFDWERSGLAILPSRNDNRKLTAFRHAVAELIVVGISPTQMETVSMDESERLQPLMQNFVSWCRRTSQEDIRAMLGLFDELKRVLPGFVSFRLKDAGEEAKEMKVDFDHPGAPGKTLSIGFGALSDGQRVLIALYTLMHGLKERRPILFIDEPDNYVSLREVQPWLATLDDWVGDHFEQAVLISHHPEIINYLGASNGRWFSRADAGHATVTAQPPVPTDGLTIAETIARGWEK